MILLLYGRARTFNDPNVLGKPSWCCRDCWSSSACGGGRL